MAKHVRLPDTVYNEADRLADEKEMSLGEAVRLMCREGGYDV